MTENVQNSTFDTTNNKWLDVWNEFKNHKGALAGAIIFALIVILVLLGPFVWPYEANGINIRIRNQGPSLAHPLGTDQLVEIPSEDHGLGTNIDYCRPNCHAAFVILRYFDWCGCRLF